MDIFDEAEDTMSQIRGDISSMRTELTKQMAIFNDATEYAGTSIKSLNEKVQLHDTTSVNTVVLVDAEAVTGTYDKYGITVHPNYDKEPNNIFNFLSATGPIFKNNANVYLNDSVVAGAASMLQHDAIKDKTYFYTSYDSPNVTLKITVNPNDLYGSTIFNTIEILPFLPGAMDITGIRIYTMHDYRQDALIASILENETIPSIGAGRIVTNKAELYSCEIDFHINFRNSAGKYPFGLKHIYFLNANYDDKSYIVVKLKRDRYIDWVSDDITIHDQNGIRLTSCSKENIKIYDTYTNGVLTGEVTPVKGITQHSLAKNTRELYLSIPVTKSLISLKFKEIGER